ncbi:outer membrane homotrimeric porin, partial [Desulfovibrio sp.]|uniref:outer membrane homotrimeric porin n=1 Tax=Desulfovibrio sp. TaxID=885 RepID=UPI00307F09FE
QLDAVASEALSGTVFFEIGDQVWGNAKSGGALGADGTVVELKNAYIDWMVPNTDLKFRMGIQGIQLPNVAGGSAVFDDDVAGVVASYQFNENVGLTTFWARPYNDNYAARADRTNYQDNMDLFALMVPLTFDGVKVTPWAMYGMAGANSKTARSMGPYTRPILSDNVADTTTSKAYGSMFWAGLPISLTLWDPLNVELDINYGYVESMGRYTANRYNGTGFRMGDTKREGWLVKALVEYKMDWGTPGIFGWYASGDDGNVKNGSERMPTVSGCGNFMSFMGDGNYGWSSADSLYDRNLTYTGTWGIGLRIHDLSFVEDLKHSFRVAYWGGTNSPSMAKYVEHSYGWDNGLDKDGHYLTTNDGLLEFNLVNSYQIYENLEANLELGYIVNMMDDDTWKRSYRNDSYKKQDAWKAQLIFAYSF